MQTSDRVGTKPHIALGNGTLPLKQTVNGSKETTKSNSETLQKGCETATDLQFLLSQENFKIHTINVLRACYQKVLSGPQKTQPSVKFRSPDLEHASGQASNEPRLTGNAARRPAPHSDERKRSGTPAAPRDHACPHRLPHERSISQQPSRARRRSGEGPCSPSLFQEPSRRCHVADVVLSQRLRRISRDTRTCVERRPCPQCAEPVPTAGARLL